MEFVSTDHHSTNSRKKDTIPKEIKTHFWKDKQPPNLHDYDVIGFDADHCIVKYNVRELMELLVKVELEDLHDLGYPDEILELDIQ